MSLSIQTLFVFHDGECGLCQKARNWLGRARQRVPLVLMSYQDPAVSRAFPALALMDPGRDMVVISDDGRIYRGESAWIVILWALRDYRRLAFRLARPAWRGRAKAMVHWLSLNRRQISSRLRLRPAAARLQ